MVVHMSEHQPHLRPIFADAFRQLDRNRPVPEINILFYPYAGLHHTIRLRSGHIYVRISDIFRDAPLSVHRALAFILVSRLLHRPTPEIHNRTYRDYACTSQVLRASDIARRQRGRKMITTARGRFYDLERMFQRLNRRHFDNSLRKPTLTWSQRRTQRVLGHHDAVHNTIVISKTLDSHDLPEWFVEYIMFHEMLHIKHPARIINGRRYYHTKAFRQEEQRFPRYHEALEWLDHIAQQRRAPRARAA